MRLRIGGQGELSGSEGRRRWAALMVLCLGQLMIVLDATVVNVALPVIQRQLHFSQASLSWVVNAYLLTFGGLLMLAGRLGDLVGRVRVFMFAIAAFSVASMLCGLSPNGAVLVGARFLQGATAAMIAAMALGIISPMFPEPRERTLAVSVYGCVSAAGGSLGLVFGGAVTQLLSWHWIFFVNLPIGAAAFLAGRRLLKKDQGIGLQAGADILGALLVTAAPTLAVYGMVNAGNTSWGSATTIAALGGAAALAIAFLIAESKIATPLIPPRILRNRDLGVGAVVRLLFPVGGFGLNFLGALYFQHVLGYSPLQTGLAFVPMTILTAAVALIVSPPATRRFGYKLPTLAGLLLATIGLLLMTRITEHSSYVTNILPTAILDGAGMGLVMTPTITTVMTAVEPGDSGLASGVANISVQLGTAFAVAALATVSASRTALLLAQHQPVLSAMTDGYRLAFGVGAGFTALSFVVTLFFLRPGRAPVLAEPRPEESVTAVA